MPDDAALEMPVQEAERPSLGQPDFAFAQQEMKTIEAFDWVSDTLFPRLLQGAVIVAAIGASISGVPWLPLAAGVGIFGFELGRAHLRNQADLNRELTLYRNEIADTLGKPMDGKLSIADMREAAKEIKPLELELKHLDYRGKYNMISAVGRAAVTVAAAFVFKDAVQRISGLDFATLMSSGQTIFFGITGALAGIGAVTAGLERLGKMYFDGHKPPSVYTDLTRLQEMAKQQDISPDQVFQVTLKLDKGLANEVRQQFGKPYAELTFSKKQQALEAFEEQSHAAALAKAISAGELPVTAIGLSAYKQMEWPKPVPASVPAANENAPEEPCLDQELSASAERTITSFVAELARKRGNFTFVEANADAVPCLRGR